jgi:glycine/D-amino acid oxidase-like deaminating enzyme
MKAETYDVAVVGAGIVGAACADECARQGLRVIIVDRDLIAGGATGTGMGHIVVMNDSEAQFALTRYSQQLWQQLRPELLPDAEYEQCGTIWVAADDDEMAEVRRKHSYYGQRGVPTEILDSPGLERLEPNLRKGLAGGLLVPEDGVVHPPSVARSLIERAQAAGAKLQLGAAVSHIGKGQVRMADGTRFSADTVINAAGASASALTPGVSVKKRKGHLTITDRYPGFVHHQLVEMGYVKSAHSTSADSVAFNVQPRRYGQIIIGSSRQYGAEHSEVDSDLFDRMLQRAYEYMPKLAGLSTARVWTGFRPASPDNLPLIGPWPDDPTLFLAAGHEGLGITASLATGRLLADQIAGRASAIPVAPYWPSRFTVDPAGQPASGYSESRGGRG